MCEDERCMIFEEYICYSGRELYNGDVLAFYDCHGIVIPEVPIWFRVCIGGELREGNCSVSEYAPLVIIVSIVLGILRLV